MAGRFILNLRVVLWIQEGFLEVLRRQMHLCVSSSIWALLTICFGFEGKRELHKKKITIKNMINTSSTCVSMHALHEILHLRAFYLLIPMFLYFQTSSLNYQICCCIQLYQSFPNSQFFDSEVGLKFSYLVQAFFLYWQVRSMTKFA